MEANQHNTIAWNTGVYQAWVNRFGEPKELAEKLKEDPKKRIGHILEYIDMDIQGKRIINLLGSNGSKAVAMALLGAAVTVVDISSDNEKYASALADHAGVEIRYLVSDVLQLAEEELINNHDVVFMELGILHYFQDLSQLFSIVAKLLNNNGRFVLHDFHPVSTKLISSRGTTAKIRKHKVTGDYFDTTLEEKEVSYAKFLAEDAKKLATHKVFLRNWTLGEIITAIATEGLFIEKLVELPNQSSEAFDKGIPKTFVVTAKKC